MERTWSLQDSGKVQVNEIRCFGDPLWIKALRAAQSGFRGVHRRLPKNFPENDKPPTYLSHVVEVGVYLAKYLYPPAVSTAGLLHDHPEDLRHKRWTVERIHREYSLLIGDLVWLVTKPERGTWDEQAEGYYRRLARPNFRKFKCKDVEPETIRKWGLAICAADKCSNMRSSVALARKGIPTEFYLKHGWEKNADRFERLRALMDDEVAPLLLREYDHSLARFKATGLRLATRFVV